jgi:hypothetical protein
VRTSCQKAWTMAACSPSTATPSSGPRRRARAGRGPERPRRASPRGSASMALDS